jgi:hypothetical protein
MAQRSLKQILTALIAMSFLIGACSTHKANFSYSEFKSDMPIIAGSQDGEEVGSVEGSKGGFLWTSCNQQARDAVRYLISNARAKGANAIGNIKWRAAGTSNPTCKKSWGFVLILPFMLTPLFASSHADATAYKTGAKKAGLFMLPTNEVDHEFLINEILALSMQ